MVITCNVHTEKKTYGKCILDFKEVDLAPCNWSLKTSSSFVTIAKLQVFIV